MTQDHMDSDEQKMSDQLIDVGVDKQLAKDLSIKFHANEATKGDIEYIKAMLEANCKMLKKTLTPLIKRLTQNLKLFIGSIQDSSLLS